MVSLHPFHIRCFCLFQRVVIFLLYFSKFFYKKKINGRDNSANIFKYLFWSFSGKSTNVFRCLFTFVCGLSLLLFILCVFYFLLLWSCFFVAEQWVTFVPVKCALFLPGKNDRILKLLFIYLFIYLYFIFILFIYIFFWGGGGLWKVKLYKQ